RLVIEHGTVEETRSRRVDAGTPIGREITGDEFVAPRPGDAARGAQPVDLDDPCRRKRTRERRGGARGKGEGRCIGEAEIALDFAVGKAAVGEVQDVTVLTFLNGRR